MRAPRPGFNAAYPGRVAIPDRSVATDRHPRATEPATRRRLWIQYLANGPAAGDADCADMEFLVEPHPTPGRNEPRVRKNVIAAWAASEVRRQLVRAQVVRGDVEDATADHIGDPQPPVGSAGQRTRHHERK